MHLTDEDIRRLAQHLAAEQAYYQQSTLRSQGGFLNWVSKAFGVGLMHAIAPYVGQVVSWIRKLLGF